MDEIKILVTGAHGFIGSRLVAFLKEKNYFVRGVDIAQWDERKKWYELADEDTFADLRDLNTALQLTKDIDYVFHFASDMGGVEYFHNHDFYPYLNNMQMDMNILKACEQNKVKRLIYSSSACAYPTHIQFDKENVPSLREDMLFPASADQMYGWEKLMMLMLCERSPLDARVGIFHTIFGEGQEAIGERAKFPPTIVHKAKEAKRTNSSIEIWGNGEQQRSFLYIEDALEKIYELATAKYYGPVNIANDEIVTVEQCARWCCEFAGIEPNFVYNNNMPSGVFFRGVDNTKWNTHYKYRNKIATKEGFRRLFEYKG